MLYLQVPFTIERTNEAFGFDVIDMFAMYVLCQFDLPLCRLALRFSLKDLNKSCYCLDVSAIDFIKENTQESRIEKYEERRRKRHVQPPSLKILCLMSLFKLAKE